MSTMPGTSLYYLRSMQRLHPTVHKQFMEGEHVIHHQDGLWNGIWSDLFIETTYMRYGKGPSGIIGSTLNDSTLAIRALSVSTLGQLSNDLAAMQNGKTQRVVTCHKEEQHTRVKADSDDRMKIREALSTCIGVFDSENHPTANLVNIYSGQVVDDDKVNVDDSCSSTLEYASSIWDHHQIVYSEAIEKVQRRAARFVKNDYSRTTSVSNLLEDLNWDTLEKRRMKARLTTLYKETNGIIPINIHHILADHTSPATRASHDLNFKIPHANTNCYKYSLYHIHAPSHSGIVFHQSKKIGDQCALLQAASG